MRSLLRNSIVPVLALSLFAAGCGTGEGDGTGPGPSPDDATNPFLTEYAEEGKADSAYINPDGIEVEVDLEADVEADEYRLNEGPAALGQYALTYMRKNGEIYLESLAEDSTSENRVEWKVDDKWITAAEARDVDPSKLRRWRLRGVNAVLLHEAARGVTEGKVFKAPVPMNPFTTMKDAGHDCAEPDGHITLDQGVYWYMWEPENSSCKLPLQDLSITISKLLPKAPTVYPEYDKLIADGKITIVFLNGQIGDGAISDSDIGMVAHRRLAGWLSSGGFTEVKPAPVGRRFTKKVGRVTFEIDLYSPHDFSGLGDYAHFDNLQKAISEHEIVVYDGHSMLGASDFWARPKYPNFYQIFLYGGCLGYEYYVKPIVTGKGGWGNVDIVSSTVEVSVDATVFAAPFVSRLMTAAKYGFRTSWKSYLNTIRENVGDSTFGVSGVRDNCYSPTGSRCAQ